MRRRREEHSWLLTDPRKTGMRVLSTGRATAVLMFSLATAKLTGFAREILIAPTFGYGVNTDAYFIGFQIPDLFYQLLIGGTFAAAVTPAMSAALARDEEKKIWRSLSTLINVFLIAFLTAILLGELFAGPIIRLYNPNKDAAIIERAISVARMLFPQIIFLFLAGMCVGVLNGHKLFQRAAFTTTLYNLVCIFFMIRWGDQSAGAPARVALGVVISSAVNFLYLAFMARRVIHYKPIIDLQDRGYRKLMRLAVPTLISGTAIQLNSIIQTGFANQFTGAVTSLRHAQTMWKLPYGIFALAVASVMSPSLTRAFANRRFEDMRKIYTESLRRALYFVTPFVLIFAVMAEETVEAVFQWRGAIPLENLLIEGSLLRLYSPAIFFLTFYEVANQAFYARHMTRVSLLTSIVSLVLNPLFCVLFTQVFDWGIYGLPVAYILNSAINMVMISFLYRLHIKKARPYRMLPFYLRLAFCSATTVIVILGLNTLPLEPSGKIGQLLIYSVKALMAILTYYLTGLAINFRESKDLQGMIRRFLKLSPARS
ncbi:MAG TPA: murein biosynthesis integral membrane protein MurJ [Bacillota bacterium]|jgi:putative peptidoglycan lipid II flippase|nr:murein biosynthesis integral membrane protein MurJ [Fastidiosipila sp.]HPX93519.1 murein biosynthesis integral membrane protein MurJ [Bacillota bacterium]HQB81743.1 murein biosynthesis integral membrane protein MurJ [Bacillota bacterium]